MLFFFIRNDLNDKIMRFYYETSFEAFFEKIKIIFSLLLFAIGLTLMSRHVLKKGFNLENNDLNICPICQENILIVTFFL